jgi:hypothetical protein
MALVGLLVVLGSFAWLAALLLRRFHRLQTVIDKIQGPTAWPLVGNLLQFRYNPDGWLDFLYGNFRLKK